MKWNVSYVHKQLSHLKKIGMGFRRYPQNAVKHIATTVHEKAQIVEIGEVVSRVIATAHDEKHEIRRYVLTPCCLVFVGQTDNQ